MAPAVTTNVSELPDSRVRIEAQVAAGEVARRLEQSARHLGRDMRVPGFRKGKAPADVVIRRFGREAVLDEAIRSSIGGWYADVIGAAEVVPVGEPRLQLGDLPDEGQPLSFAVEVGVRPKAALGPYGGIEVGRREPQVPPGAVAEELEGLRDQLATLETVEHAARNGDFVLIDYLGTLEGEPFEGGEGRDQLVELGAGRLIPGFEDQLVGAAAGEQRTVTATFPADYGAEQLAGRDASFAVTVTEVKRKRLPELDDDFASEAGFDTLAELRADVEGKLAEAERDAIEEEFGTLVLDSVVKASKVELPDELVIARAEELWHDLLHSLSHRGISKDAYLSIAGRTEEEMLANAREQAARGLARDSVLAAVVEAEGIEPTDEELLGTLAAAARHEQTTPEKLRDRLKKAGRLDAVRKELASRQALDLLVERAVPISIEQAMAREALWTPDRAEQTTGPPGQARPGELWTPGSPT